MSRIRIGGQAPEQQLRDAAEAMESMLVKQVLKSSGAFRGAGAVAGAEIRTDMFVEAIADAVAKAGGFGLADTLEAQLRPPNPTRQVHDDRLERELSGSQGKRVPPRTALKAYHRGDD